MKIRTDFVTNSSSSSFVAIKVVMKDGTVITSESAMDDIGHGSDPEPIAALEESDVLELLNSINNGKELMDALDEHYENMFEVFPPSENSLNSDWVRFIQESYDKYNYEGMTSIVDFEEVDKIFLEDTWRPEGETYRVCYEYDPNEKIIVNVIKEYEGEEDIVFEDLLQDKYDGELKGLFYDMVKEFDENQIKEAFDAVCDYFALEDAYESYDIENEEPTHDNLVSLLSECFEDSGMGYVEFISEMRDRLEECNIPFEYPEEFENELI